jgi:hypothetical protein
MQEDGVPGEKAAKYWASLMGSIWAGKRPPSVETTGKLPAFSHLSKVNVTKGNTHFTPKKN